MKNFFKGIGIFVGLVIGFAITVSLVLPFAVWLMEKWAKFLGVGL